MLYSPQWDVYVLPGYDEVRHVLQDWETFSSASGVGLTPRANAMSGRGILTTDPPLHDTRRRVLERPTRATRGRPPPRVPGRSSRAARVRVSLAGSFDAVADLAHPYSVQVVADLCGLPEEGRQHLIERASAAFNTFGPDNELCRQSWHGVDELYDYATNVATPERLTPGRWGTEIYEAAADGAIEPEACPGLVLAYAWAGMDTTVNAIASAVSLFADHPDQWAALRADRSLLVSATNEVLRIEPPVQRFTRITTRERSTWPV